MLGGAGEPGITVVVTRDRVASLRPTLDELPPLRSRPEIVVVDNGSTDGTPGVVASEFPHVTVVAWLPTTVRWHTTWLGRQRGSIRPAG